MLKWLWINNYDVYLTSKLQIDYVLLKQDFKKPLFFSKGEEIDEEEETDEGKRPPPRRPYYRGGGGRGFYRGFYQGGPRRPPRYQNAIMDGPGRQPQFRRPYWRRGYRRYYAQVGNNLFVITLCNSLQSMNYCVEIYCFRACLTFMAPVPVYGEEMKNFAYFSTITLQYD